MAFTVIGEAVSAVIPVILLPRYWHERRVMRVRIRTLEEGTSRTTIRMDVKAVNADRSSPRTDRARDRAADVTIVHNAPRTRKHG